MIKEGLLKSRSLLIILLLFMLFNLTLLFIIDNYVVREEVYRETGSVANEVIIPNGLEYTTSYSVYTTELLIQGCCNIVILDNLHNETQVLDFNEIMTKKFVAIGINSYYIQYVNGSFNYTYIVLKERKPLIYLSIPATVFSIIGFFLAILLLSYHLATSSSKTGISKAKFFYTLGYLIQILIAYCYNAFVNNSFKHLFRIKY
ncbi:MAG: hypothetical protein QW170_04275 [Desulfurococcaceae archaeon]